jgi:hypothetical protein
MKEVQYLDIILGGILKQESLLKSYLIRKQKETEKKNLVSEIEFFQKCRDTVALLENNIETQYLEKRRELYQTIEILKSKNKTFEKELEFAENFSLERFHVNLSTMTNGRYKDELWFSQINNINKCLVKIKNQNFKKNIEIKDLDIDNYLNFIFSQKSITRESKKTAVLKLMNENNQEKTISNYRIWIDYVFNQQNYWKELNEEDKKSFEKIRTKSLNEIIASFENYKKGSPKPKASLIKEFEASILERLSDEPFYETTSDFMEGLLTKDMNKLAIIIGKLDFIKNLNEAKEKKLSTKLQPLLYWLELMASGKEPPKDFEGNFIKSEIEKIGASRCNNKGQYFYKSFKDIDISNQVLLIKMFGKNWKEDIKKISNNIKIIKYIEENFS